MNKLILYLILSTMPLLLCAQENTLSLQDCINMAIENNLDLESSRLSAASSSINFKQDKNALLPTINGNYNIGLNQGRSIDPFTNDFVNEEFTFSSAGLRLGTTIFNGFNLINSLKQSQLNLKASQMEIEAAKQDLILNVTLTYLQVLNAKELLKLSKVSVASTQEQLKRLKSLFDAESGNPASYRDLQGQFASDKSALINNENALALALIDLNRLVNPEKEIGSNIKEILINDFNYRYNSQDIYQQSLATFPNVKANDLRLQASEKGIAIAKSLFVPQVSLFANLNTNFSSAARLFNQNGSVIEETGSFVTIDGTDIPVFRENTIFEATEISYRDQLDNNLNTSYGVSVSVPIFNGFNAKNNVGLEKIKVQEAQITLDQTKLDLKQAIDRSYSIMETTLQNYRLLEEQVTAYEESYRINNILFENGATNSTDYILSKNTLENARINLANTKYAYALRIKVLEYYRTGIN